MDSQSLKSASAYLNNLLLARGLLRNGKPLEFAHPSKAEGGKQETMAQIINLVHDLILRRDREQDQRDSLSQTLRAVRADNQKATTTIERLQQRSEDLQRQLSLSQSSERSAKNALRSAESSARSLREEMLRLKTTVQQVRTACANDVRKRDVQIQRLKTHLTAQQRGNRMGLVGASITITPGSTGSGPAGLGRDEDMPSVDDAEYSLKQETTEFLTQLSQGLSDENDNLIGLVRSTLATLRELQGMPEHGQSEPDADSAHEDGEDSMLHALPTSYEALATDMDHVLENLRSLLTNPNFVSISEVESREEEIIKLREGWEKMEARWRDVVVMMQGWRQRMMDGGDTITLDELRMGLGPGDMLASVAEEEEEDEGEIDSEVDMDDEEIDDIDNEPALPSPEKPLSEDRKTDLFDIKLEPTPHHALRESDGNTSTPITVCYDESINTPNTLAYVFNFNGIYID
ncbi:nima interactive protein [Neofusicoccum parvum]|uniref:Nima interactive protein n=1 Tax=Neofusicoccum parvum TaxID=310453 RepID=A0ACB5RRU6_9PEZI|nr:nima interactive protein [Neofusicoccum parvum]